MTRAVVQQSCQYIWVERLRGVLVETSVARHLAIGVPPEAGDGNDPRMVHVRSLAQASRHFVPVHLGHGDVQKDHVWEKRGNDFERSASAVCDAHFMTAQVQQVREALRRIDVVIDHENPVADCGNFCFRRIARCLVGAVLGLNSAMNASNPPADAPTPTMENAPSLSGAWLSVDTSRRGAMCFTAEGRGVLTFLRAT